MRDLYLVRHARAMAIGATDKARELAPSGCADALKLGALFRAKFTQPEQVLCSSAKRTCQTLELMMQEGLAPQNQTIEEGLYNASALYLFDMIKASNAQSLLLLGHNPALAILLNRLSDDDNFAPELMHFPTATIAHLTIEETAFANLSEASNISLKSLIRGSQC